MDVEIPERNTFIPEGTILPDPIEVKGYTVRGTLIPYQDGNQLQISVSPKPPEKETSIIYKLAFQLFFTLINLKSKNDELQKSKNENERLKSAYIKLLEEKVQLQTEVKELKIKLETILEENKNIKNDLTQTRLELHETKEKLNRTDEELHETKEKLNRTDEELNKIRSLSAIGAWIETARRQIVWKIDSSVPRDKKLANEAWKTIKDREQDVLKTANELYFFINDDWRYVSEELYATRNNEFHYQPSFEETIKLLDYLPEEYRQDKEFFEKFIYYIHENEKIFYPINNHKKREARIRTSVS